MQREQSMDELLETGRSRKRRRNLLQKISYNHRIDLATSFMNNSIGTSCENVDQNDYDQRHADSQKSFDFTVNDNNSPSATTTNNDRSLYNTSTSQKAISENQPTVPSNHCTSSTNDHSELLSDEENNQTGRPTLF